jgi:hypothetical protein
VSESEGGSRSGDFPGVFNLGVGSSDARFGAHGTGEGLD